MENGLDVVAVGVEHERAVIPRVVLRALPRPSVVAIPRRRRAAMEFIDSEPVGDGEGEMHVLGLLAAVADEGERAGAVSHANAVRV